MISYSQCRSLAVGGGNIYWADWGVDTGPGGELFGDSVGRANLVGGDIDPNFIKTETPIHAVAVDARHIYWGTERSIARANLAGGHIEPDFIPLGCNIGPHGLPTPIYSIDVAEGHIYWVEEHAIARAGLDGRNIDRRFIPTPGIYVSSVAVGGGYIFWNAGKPLEKEIPNPNWNPPWAESIGRANLDGSDVQEDFIKFAVPLEGELAVKRTRPRSPTPRTA
jgi:hypothetical protein